MKYYESNKYKHHETLQLSLFCQLGNVIEFDNVYHIRNKMKKTLHVCDNLQRNNVIGKLLIISAMVIVLILQSELAKENIELKNKMQ